MMIKFLALIIFGYLVWRNLSHEYTSSKIIKMEWIWVIFGALGGVGVGRLITNVSDGGWQFNYPAAITGVIIGLAILSRKWGWKYASIGEDLFFYFWGLGMFWMVLETVELGLELEVVNRIILWFIAGVITLMARGKYRSWVWYKSGKKGFLYFYGSFWLSLLLAMGSLWLGSGIFVSGYLLFWSLISGLQLVILGEVFGKVKFLSF